MDLFDVAGSVVAVQKDGYGTQTAQNLGPGSLFYKAGTTVSSGSNDGTLTSGASLSLTGPTSFVAVSQGAKLAVLDPADVKSAGFVPSSQVGQPGGVVAMAQTMAGAAAPDAFVYDPVTFLSVVDPIWKIGYNPDGTVASEPQWYVGIEGNYRIAANTEGLSDGLPHNKTEFYINYASPDGTSVVNFRPIYANAGRDSNSTHWSQVIFDVGTAGFPYSQVQFKAGDATNIMVVSGGGVFVQSGMALQVAGKDVQVKPAQIPTRYGFPSASPTTVAVTANLLYYAAVDVENACTLTGLNVYVGGTAAGNVAVALYDSTGTQVAASNLVTAQSASTFASQAVPFTSPVAVTAGRYYGAVIYSNATATISRVTALGGAAQAAQGGFTLPATITAPGASAAAQVPTFATY